MTSFDVGVIEMVAREYGEPHGARVERVGDSVMVAPAGAGWPFMVHVCGDEATVELPFGARLGVGSDGVGAQPLDDVIRSVMDGRVQVWLGRSEQGWVGAQCVRVWWGRNAIAGGDDRRGPMIAAVAYAGTHEPRS